MNSIRLTFVVVLLSVLGLFPININALDIKLKNLSIENGLSNQNINGIVQDVDGFIWIATMRGLNRYDGYTFQHYEFIPNDRESIRSNHINSICFWNDYLLLVGTNEGVDCFDIRSGKAIPIPFVSGRSPGVRFLAKASDAVFAGTDEGLYFLSTKDDRPGAFCPTSLTSDDVNHIFVSQDDDVWCVLGQSSQFVRYSPSEDRAEYFRLPVPALINSVNEYDDESIVLATTQGIFFFCFNDCRFVVPPGWKEGVDKMRHQEVSFVMKHDGNVYWISGNKTLFSYDTTQGHIEPIDQEKRQQSTFRCYLCDRDENVWLGSFETGIAIVYKRFEAFNFDRQLNDIIADNFVMAVAEDRSGNLIFGLRDKKIIVYTPLRHQSVELNLPVGYGTRIRSLMVDSDGIYWIGTNYGAMRYDPTRKFFSEIPVPEYSGGVVTFIEFEDRVYAGTSNAGILVYDMYGEFVKQITGYGENIPEIIAYDDRRLVFSSYGQGLYLLSEGGERVEKLEFGDRDTEMRFSYVIAMACDKEYLWAGTYNYGLLRRSLASGQVRKLQKRNGLPSNDVVGICSGLGESLWLSTSFGLVGFDKARFEVETIYYDDATGYQYHQNAACRTSDSTVYFGGNNGVSYFRLDSESLHSHSSPRIQIERIELFKGRGTEEIIPSEGKLQVFTHRDKYINFHYIAIDYAAAQGMTYFYMLEGFDSDWHEAGVQRNVSYSNLPRGRYTFRVRARNSDGVWSKNEAAVPFRVKPSPWLSLTAWIVYVSLFCAIGLFLIRLFIRNKLYKTKLEQEQYDHAREQEMEQMKRRFFTNIAHEFRTPLTLISIISERLYRSDSADADNYAKSVSDLDYNVKRMLKLTNQLLSFRHLEGETMPLWICRSSLHDDVDAFLSSVRLLAERKSITLGLHCAERFEFPYDRDKLEKITNNLLTNAIKHTPVEGRIDIRVERITAAEALSRYPHTDCFNPGFHTDHYVEVSVADSGEGIAEDILPNIFERYVYREAQTADVGERPNSSGIGLHFSKALTELHKGSITVQSRVGAGSIFSYVVPWEADIYSSEELGIDANVAEPAVALPACDVEQASEPEVPAAHLHTLVIIEDNAELNRMLCSLFSGKYNVHQAYEGRGGYELVRQVCPDLVVSDVMLPQMTGIELTCKLKNDSKYSYIPIILLSAKSELHDQLDGMEVGADFYLPKPFQTQYLLTLVNNVLENRKRFMKVFMNGLMPNLNKTAASQTDLKFVAKLNELIEANIVNPNLDVTFMAKHMGMSRSSLYRSFVEIMNMPPNTYLRKIKINKAVELMKQDKYTLREIVDLTGFGSTTYFSTVFKTEKHMTPSEYQQRLKNGGVAD